MRIIVTGDRFWNCQDLAARIVVRLIKRYGEILIVHGGACGGDQSFSLACQNLGVPTESYPTRWSDVGNRAGPFKNGEMVAAGAQLCIALHRTLETGRERRTAVGKLSPLAYPHTLLIQKERCLSGWRRGMLGWTESDLPVSVMEGRDCSRPYISIFSGSATSL